MDIHEDEGLQCSSSLHCESPKRTVVDAGVQLDLNNECKSDSEELESAFENNFTNLNMKLPVAVQSCVPAGLQVSSELVVITNAGTGFINEQKLPISTFHTSDGSEPLNKRLCIEQDGHTYILALQDNMIDGLTGVVEIPQKPFTSVETAQLLNYQDSSDLQNKQGINQNWFTSREEKTTLHSKGHMWKQGMWSKEEVELLENNIRLYCDEHDTDPATIVFEMSKDERKDFYRTIAKGLNRPLFSVYRRVIRMYDNKNHVGKYTTDELEKLKKLRSIYGNDWQAIGAAMGRSASSIKDRCRLMKDNCNQGKWLPAEEDRLTKAVYQLANAVPGEMISTGLSWATVADRVGTRSEKQCRTKWLNYLNWKVAGGTDWTREDDINLICRVYALNATDENQVDWSELAKGWLSVRSPQWLRGKWWSLKRHVPNSNDICFQDICEHLYQHFVLKMKIKDENCESVANVDIQAMLNRPKPTVMQSVAISNTPPPGIVVTAAAQACPPSIVSLPNAPCMGMVNTPANLTPVRVGPVLQTIEVLPQNIELANTPANIQLANQAFLLAAPAQPTLPLSTALPSNQIIIQTLPPDDMQTEKTLHLQMNSPHVIIDTSTTTLTSLASTQIPSAPSSPVSVEDDLDDQNSILLESSFRNNTIDENGNISQECDIENEHQVNVDETKSNHLIADPMLAGNHSPGITISEMHSPDEHLEPAH